MSTAGNPIPGRELSVRVESGGADLVEQLAPAWRRLCDEAADEIFYRPEWTHAYLRAFAPEARITVISAWAGDRLHAVVPLLRERTWIGGLPAVRLSIPGNVHSARLGFPLSPGKQGEQALRAVWQAVKELPGWSMLDVSQVLEGSGIDRLAMLARGEHFPVARKRTSQTLYLPTSASARAAPKDLPLWMAETRPKFRSHLRRSRRQMEEQGTLMVQHYGAADPGALEKFYDLEASGWKGAEGTAIQCDPRTRQFYDAIAQAAAQQGYFSLDFLELNSKPIAGHLGFNFNGRYFLVKAGYDESYRRHGPGQLLVNEILNQTPQRGLREFDFVGPATWDEGRWASARRTSYRVFIFRNNWYGGLLYELRILLRDGVRRLLGQLEDENAPLDLSPFTRRSGARMGAQSRPHGSDKDPGDAG
jgi:CelD/BcsL family acetyltransferase involved in cellulose biosynthesis